MATRQTRLDTGRSRAAELNLATIGELRRVRQVAGISQAALARQLGWPQSRVSDLERHQFDPTITDVALVAALLGLKPAIQLYPVGEPLRDAGQQALIRRFRSVLSPAWRVKLEAPFPNLGDLRSWDVLLRLTSAYRVGVEAETRIRDEQELVRRVRQRELHGGVDAILVVLSDSVHNRRHVDALRQALGDAYESTPRTTLAALRLGEPLPGSGVILL